MRKNFGAKTWVYPMPVFIIGTYDEAGKAIAYDGVHHNYLRVSGKVGNAFSDGKQLK